MHWEQFYVLFPLPTWISHSNRRTVRPNPLVPHTRSGLYAGLLGSCYCPSPSDAVSTSSLHPSGIGFFFESPLLSSYCWTCFLSPRPFLLFFPLCDIQRRFRGQPFQGGSKRALFRLPPCLIYIREGGVGRERQRENAKRSLLFFLSADLPFHSSPSDVIRLLLWPLGRRGGRPQVVDPLPSFMGASSSSTTTKRHRRRRRSLLPPPPIG